MAEDTTKAPETPQTPASTPMDLEELSNPNFSLSKNAIPETAEPQTQDIMSRLNENIEKREIGNEVNLQNIMEHTAAEPVQGQVVLGDSGIQIKFANRNYKLRYRNIFILSLIITIFCGCVSLVLGMYDKYMYYAAQPVVDPQYANYIATYKGIEQSVMDTLAFSDYPQYRGLSLIGPEAKQTIQSIINAPKLNYIQKKDLLQADLDALMNKYIDNQQQLDTVKKNVTEYGFFSQDLFGLLQNEEYISSIKQSLLSLEMIKFSTAIKVFSYLDTFITSMGNLLNISPTDVSTKLDTITQRGEKDIQVYLNDCYLNPYEVDYDCNIVGDFDRYYTQINAEKTTLDRTFFKKLMQYVDVKLEQADLPSFSITFQQFNPVQKEVSFAVAVNTTQEDELALTKKGIENPHIFIVSNLLNLIKQSLFVVGENIDAKSLKIATKTVKIGSSVFTIHSSNMNFTLPLQKSTQREITDYTNQDILNTTQ